MKRSKSRINSSCDGNIFSSEQRMDIERCQEELKKSRIKYNKLTQNYLELKVEYNKLEKDYKYNVRIIEAIINESNIKALSEFLDGPKNTLNENENNNKVKMNQTSLSKTTIKILKEKSIYERLKLEIMNLREELKTKENTIDDLKNNVKTSKFKELDNKYAQIYQEYNAVKSRNEILETMQADYIKSKNQIMFLLKQIDLYKKENKKLKELYEKLLYDYQNIIKERDQSETIRNINEERIKALITKNNSLKVKLEDLRNKNLAYYEEIEKYKNLNQNQIDKIIVRKEKEINQYRSQITQLKLEIGSLQKKAEEKNKNTINSASGYKKIKPIYPIKKEYKELRKTDSDFFVTKPKIILSNDKIDKKINNEKILINSKIKENSNDNNNQQKKLSVVKIKDNKELENKNESSDLIDGNHYENKLPKNIVIKGEKNMHEKKTTAYEEEINMDFKKDESFNKDEILNIKEKISEKEKEKEISIKNNSNNDDISKYMNEKYKNIENNNINENKEINKEKNSNEINLEDNTNNNDNDIDINNNNINQELNEQDEQNEEKEKDKEINYEEEFEKSEENKKENISQEKKKKYKEEEIVANMSNDKEEKEEKSNQEKKNESSDGYNDFESNIDKKSSLKENNNITNEKSSNNNLKGTNNINKEQKNELNENSNKLKESNSIDFNIKNENNNLNEEEKKDEKNEEKEKDDNDDEEYKFSSRNEGLSEEN